jgi:hypothetical protein
MWQHLGLLGVETEIAPVPLVVVRELVVGGEGGTAVCTKSPYVMFYVILVAAMLAMVFLPSL